MKQQLHIKQLVMVSLFFVSAGHINAQADRPSIDTTVYKTIRVKPSAADASVTYWDSAHAIYYDPKIRNNKLLLWLTGTGGSTNNVPVNFFKTALEQGYRIIALSFISVPAVAQICTGSNLDANSNCAADFRRRRIYGDNDFSLIADKPQDAIIPRLIKLLQYLIKNDATGNWSQYLETGMNKPFWSRIAIAGQSQGGGMAQFIAQNENIYRSISFSGGWDYSSSADKQIAGWYFNKNVTPMENWYATYHVNESAAVSLQEICAALKITAGHVFALDKQLGNAAAAGSNPNPYHGEGIRNIAYRSVWISMLGSGL